MLSVFCDGSSSSKSGCPIGWGWLIARSNEVLAAGFGCALVGSNNTAEIRAALAGLNTLIDKGLHLAGEPVELVSDSRYTLGMATGGYTPTANVDLVKELQAIVALIPNFRARWVPGHSGDPFNERCDSLAHDAKMSLAPPEAQAKLKKKKERKAARAKLIAENPKVDETT